MTDGEEKWDDRIEEFHDRPVRTTAKAVSRGWIIVLLVIALVIGTGVILWTGRVATSDIKGQGDAVITKNEARNRINAQENFETLFADIQSADKIVGISAEALAQDPTNTKLSTELMGQKQFCVDLIGKYNAAARKFTQADFRAADLPDVIDETQTETDCKENAR